MARLVDASLWIDYTRARAPRHLKEFIAPYILDPEACLADVTMPASWCNATLAMSSHALAATY